MLAARSVSQVVRRGSAKLKKKKTASSSLDLQLVARWEQSELLAYSVQRLLVMGGAGLETVTLPGLFLFLFYVLHHLQTASSISRSSGESGTYDKSARSTESHFTN